MPSGYSAKDIERFRDRIHALEAEVERLREKLRSIVEDKPRSSIYFGGETWMGFARRLQREAAEAVREGENGY